MPFKFFLLFLVTNLYASDTMEKHVQAFKSLNTQNCPNSISGKYKSLKYDLTFVRYGFVSKSSIDSQTKIGTCTFSNTIFMLNNYNSTQEPFYELWEGLQGVNEITLGENNYLTISTFSGANGGRLYLFDTNNKYIFKPIKAYDPCLKKYLNYFQADSGGNNIFVLKEFDETKKKFYLSVQINNYSVCGEHIGYDFIKYKFDSKENRFIITERKLP